MRIHLKDIVTCEDPRMINRLFTIIGMTRLNKKDIWEDIGGTWMIKDYLTGEIKEVPGCFLTVWGQLVLLLFLNQRIIKMRVKVNSNFLMDGNNQSMTLHGMHVTYEGRVVGKIIDSTGGLTEIEIVDPIVIRFIEGGAFDHPVSMGCKVNGRNYDNIEDKSKVKSSMCGYMNRLKELGVSQKLEEE